MSHALTRPRNDRSRAALLALALATGLGLAEPAGAQVSGHAFGEPSDMVGPHVGTTGSPVRVTRRTDGGRRYAFDLGFTQATVQCCVGASCEILRGRIQIFADAESNLAGEGPGWSRGTVRSAQVYALEPTSETLAARPAQAEGWASEGRYSRVGSDLTLELTVPAWRWVGRTGLVRTCTAASVRVEGSMVPVTCTGGCSADEERYGFGPSTLTITPQ